MFVFPLLIFVSVCLSVLFVCVSVIACTYRQQRIRRLCWVGFGLVGLVWFGLQRLYLLKASAVFFVSRLCVCVCVFCTVVPDIIFIAQYICSPRVSSSYMACLLLFTAECKYSVVIILAI